MSDKFFLLSKTVWYGLLQLVTGLAVSLGVDVPVELTQDATGPVGAVLLISGVVTLLLRIVTRVGVTLR